jgi:hypothetical protein
MPGRGKGSWALGYLSARLARRQPDAENFMQRRQLLIYTSGTLAALAVPGLARAHHGWGSFDATQPIYLEGRAAAVVGGNPHTELDLVLADKLALPADLAQRTLPAQTASVDGRDILGRARLPRRNERQWHIELAPLSRLQAWKVAEIKPGDTLAVVGYTFAEEKGRAVLRAEFLFSGGGVYGLRSSPA